MDVLLPFQLKHAETRFRYIDSTGITRAAYTGAAQTTGYGGDRVGCSIDFTRHGGRTSTGKAERAALVSWLMSLNGRQGRVWMPNRGYTRRGSFPATEILANSTFSAVTGWSSSAAYQVTVSERVARCQRNSVTANAHAINGTGANASIALTQWAPHVLRVMLRGGRQSLATQRFTLFNTADSVRLEAVQSTFVPGMRTAAFVSPTSLFTPALLDEETNGPLPGDFVLVDMVSAARCALVDNGTNALTRSDEIDNAAWAKNGTTISTGSTAPNGITVADDIVENTNNGVHTVTQSVARTSAAEDLCAYGYFRRSAGTRNIELVIDDGANNGGLGRFDLGAGTVLASTNVGTGTNTRSFIVSAGNNYFFCSVVARCPATTTLRAFVSMHNGSTSSYTGDGTSAIGAWRFGAARSSVPTRGAQTVASATTGASQTGSGLYLKGLPVSATGLLLPGDWAEVITPTYSSLHMTTAALDSDAAGLGYWQFSPPIRRSPADNAPVIIHQPMGRFLYAGQFPEWLNEPGIYSSAAGEFEEACE